MKLLPLAFLLSVPSPGRAFTTPKFGLQRRASSSSLHDGGTETVATEECAMDAFTVGVLGDLHIDPRVMEDYEVGRKQWMKIFVETTETCGPDNVAIVSLGDLGESKSIRPSETKELFAGTTECHEIAAEYLGSFGIPYEVVGGNHDLEGIDEFATDEGKSR
jgi:hypothetical protein